MKDRLLQLLATEKLTALKFAEIMEVRPSNISHILSGRNNPGFDFISRLLRRFPEVSPDWLINGIGEMNRADLASTSSDKYTDNTSETAENTLFTQMSTSERFSELTEDTFGESLLENHNVDSFKQLDGLAIQPLDNNIEQPVVAKSQVYNGPQDDRPITLQALDAQADSQTPSVSTKEIPVANSHNDVQLRPEPSLITSQNDEKLPVTNQLPAQSTLVPTTVTMPNTKQIIVFYDDNTFDIYSPRK